MRLPFRRKDKDKDRKKSGDLKGDYSGSPFSRHDRPLSLFPPTYRSAHLLGCLPPPVLQRIFGFVCPNSRDDSYETCEGSAYDSGCMLCDLRDLSHCVRVSREWRKAAVPVL